jgi:glycosyltransferase involved in cell wall biosynthesis
MLRRLGHEASVVVCDNGSTDGTPDALRGLEPEIDVPHHFLFNRENRGISAARNQLIEHFLATGGDYALFVDGDIEPAPFSSFAMLRHMESAGRVLGALGAYSHDHTTERRHSTPYLFHVEPKLVETLSTVVTTGYGMFRREVFEAGVRFDASGPFEQPGWGFEDNDLAFQLTVKGFAVRRFRGVRFLHRSVRSSIPLLRRHGHDPADAFRRRQQHLIAKWEGVPLINDGPLAEVRRARLHEPPRRA